ncbi:unnamed protein product, partial [Diamesa tonsa]
MSAFTVSLIFIAAMLHSVKADQDTSFSDAASGFAGLVIIGLCVYYCRCCWCCGRSQNVVIVNQAAPPPPAYVQFV